ncbi:ABC transporter permease [Paenibacillus sp. HWE-109]|uniref:ABC transporter permease n=1 Tax=Paenibacillus sp. HWE-109 TaxID=1306526 RepID=UPI001EDF5C74|nr:ABC transporter permease [Paenibacillus sp. HWE-109]UKS24724.1 ABC transporter permease [Paenibacillus sp. HWE-109]
MRAYMTKRMLFAIPTLLGATVLIFFIFALTPGDFVDSDVSLPVDRAAELKAIYGLDQPIIERYWHWMVNALQGNLGYSLKYQMPVVSLLKTYMLNSLVISGASLLLTWVLSIGLGVLSAVRRYSWYDGVLTLLVFATMSFPTFFLGLLLIKYFAVDLGWLPVSGMQTTNSNAIGWAHLWDVSKHAFLPVAVLTIASIGSVTRIVRADVINVIKQDFIRTARAKGLKEKTVVYKHALRNAILPAITLLGLEIPFLFSGAIITEQIFTWPGIGFVHMQAISVRDYPLLMGFTLFVTVVTVAGNLMAEWLYAVADPRIRLK